MVLSSLLEKIPAGVDQFIENILENRTFIAFTAANNSPLDKCFDFLLSALREHADFSDRAVVLPYDGCQVIELSRLMQTFVIVLFEGATTSAILVDKHLPKRASFVALLNHCMLTLWVPLVIDNALLCGIMIVFTDGSLKATAEYVDDRARISLTIRNIFVDHALSGVNPVDHLECGLPLLIKAMKEQSESLKLNLAPPRRFHVDQHLTMTKRKIRLRSGADSVKFVKFLANFAALNQ